MPPFVGLRLRRELKQLNLTGGPLPRGAPLLASLLRESVLLIALSLIVAALVLRSECLCHTGLLLLCHEALTDQSCLDDDRLLLLLVCLLDLNLVDVVAGEGTL